MANLSQVPSTTRSRAVGSRGVLIIVCAGVVLASLDLFIVNVALPQIAKGLGATSLSSLSWIMNAYAIVYASLLVYFGRLADRFSRDRAFLIGVAIFTASSAACAASNSVAMLVAFRVVQAAGAALLTPTSLSLVLATSPSERRGGAVRAWTAVGGASAALGPVVGGFLVALDWRWVFLVNVPVGIIAFVAGLIYLPRVRGEGGEHPDPWGALLATGGIATLTFALVQSNSWSAWSTALTLLVAFAILALFVWHTLVSPRPLVAPSLFRSRHFVGASAVGLLFSLAFAAMLLSLSLWEQDVWHWTALRSGLAIAPGPLMVPLLAFLVTGRLIARYGPGLVMALGGGVFAAGVAWWAVSITARPNYSHSVLGGIILTGVGVGLSLPTMMSTASTALAPSAFATGSAGINMIRQTGLALGVAVLISVLGTPTMSRPFTLGDFRHGWWLTAAFSLSSVVPALWLLPRTAARDVRGAP